MITRRAFLLASLAAGAGLAGDTPSVETGPIVLLRIATGDPLGSYLPFGRLLVHELRAAYPRLHGIAIPTEGSVANLEMLRAGQADLGLSLADLAESALAGEPPFAGPTPIRALGRIFENYLQLAVRADSKITTLPQLAGRTISLGAPGSGGAVLGARLLSGAGVTGVRTLLLPSLQARQALLARTIDALLVSGGVPIPVLSALDLEVGIRLLPLSPYLSILRPAGQTGYESVPVPPGAYHGGSVVDTVGVANLLVCRADLPGDVAAMVAQILAERAGELIPAQTVGTQFLDARSLIATGAVPLHPGAVAAYRARHG